MVRGHGVRPQVLKALFKRMRDSFGQPSGVHKDQRRAMLPNQFGDTVIDIRPNRIRGNGAQLVLGDFDRQIQFPAMTHVDDGAGGQGCDLSISR